MLLLYTFLHIFLDFGSNFDEVVDIYNLEPSIPQSFELILEIYDDWLNGLLIPALSRMARYALEEEKLSEFAHSLFCLNTFERLKEMISQEEDNSELALSFLQEYFPEILDQD